MERLTAQGIFEPPEVQSLLERASDRSAGPSQVLWTLFVFQLWHRRWMKAAIARPSTTP